MKNGNRSPISVRNEVQFAKVGERDWKVTDNFYLVYPGMCLRSKLTDYVKFLTCHTSFLGN